MIERAILLRKSLVSPIFHMVHPHFIVDSVGGSICVGDDHVCLASKMASK